MFDLKPHFKTIPAPVGARLAREDDIPASENVSAVTTSSRASLAQTGNQHA
jgi:hypothetical protein